MTRCRVTFVGHDASRTGAPILLGSMLRWVQESELAQVDVVLARGGPLIDEYRRVAPVKVVETLAVKAFDRVVAGVNSVSGDPLIARRYNRLLTLTRLKSDIVVANTLAALELAAELVPSNSELVCHVHELDWSADRILPPTPRRTELIGRVDRFVATGPAVASMLIKRWRIPRSKVYTVDAFIEMPRVSPDSVERARDAMTRFGPGPIVMSVGALRRRKGPEMFVDLMGLLAGHPTSPTGIWLGGDPSGSEWDETTQDIERLGDAANVGVIGSNEYPHSYLAAADVVVSTAREDPFPLVVMEAAALGKPVVGFDSGGLAAMLRAAGCSESVVTFGDLFQMGEAVGKLLSNPGLAEDQSNALRKWVRESHLAETVAPKLWDAVSGVMEPLT